MIQNIINLEGEQGQIEVVLSEDRQTLDQYVYIAYIKGNKQSVHQKMSTALFQEGVFDRRIADYFARKSIFDTNIVHKVNEEIRIFIENNRSKNDIEDLEGRIGMKTALDKLYEILGQALKENANAPEKQIEEMENYIFVSVKEFDRLFKELLEESNLTKEQILIELTAMGCLDRKNNDSHRSTLRRICGKVFRGYKIKKRDGQSDKEVV